MAQVKIKLGQPVTSGHFRAETYLSENKERLQQFLLFVRPNMMDKRGSKKTLQGRGRFQIIVTKPISGIRIRLRIGQPLGIKIIQGFDALSQPADLLTIHDE